MEFPRFVFKDGGAQSRVGGNYSTELAQDEAEHAALLEAGWFATLPGAIAPKPAVIAPVAPKGDEDPAGGDAPPTRDEIVQKLDELGVVFDRRLGDKKLAGLLEQALKKG